TRSLSVIAIPRQCDRSRLGARKRPQDPSGLQIALRPVGPSPNKFLKYARSWSGVLKTSAPVPTARFSLSCAAPLQSRTDGECDTPQQFTAEESSAVAC